MAQFKLKAVKGGFVGEYEPTNSFDCGTDDPELVTVIAAQHERRIPLPPVSA